MPKEKRPKPPLAGIVYGELARWIALVGMIVGMIGIIIYFCGISPFFDPKLLMSALWEGKGVEEIWRESAGTELMHGHWFLGRLSHSDAISMLGIAIVCIAAAVASWGTFLGMLRERREPRLYYFFLIFICILLTLCALGIISLE